MPVKMPSFFLFCLIHVNATVLYVTPHAEISSIPSNKHGAVTQSNNTLFLAAIFSTDNACISSFFMVG